MIYTIVGYKPNGTDSVMGCVQDRVDSDFLLETFEDANGAAKRYAEMSLEEPYSRYMPHEWEISVLYNGQEEEDFRYNSMNTPIEFQLIDVFKKLCDRFIDEIKNARQEAVIAKKKKEEAQRERQKTIDKKNKERKERKELKRLIEKYNI